MCPSRILAKILKNKPDEKIILEPSLYEIEELKKLLHGLIKLEKSDNYTYPNWELSQKNTYRFLKEHPNLSNIIDEEIWHYLADIDIRKKDYRYAEIQLPIIKSILKKKWIIET